jgi:hypothetical protein
MNIHEVGDFYVCISHKSIIPCDYEGSHLISNWKPDVEKILELIKEKNNG